VTYHQLGYILYDITIDIILDVYCKDVICVNTMQSEI